MKGVDEMMIDDGLQPTHRKAKTSLNFVIDPNSGINTEEYEYVPALWDVDTIPRVGDEIAFSTGNYEYPLKNWGHCIVTRLRWVVTPFGGKGHPWVTVTVYVRLLEVDKDQQVETNGS